MKTSLIRSAALAAIAAGCLLPAPASAADEKGGYTALGLGARTCADLQSAPQDVVSIVGVYAHGYFTALNQVLPGLADLTGGRDDNAVLQEIFRSCQANANMLIADALHDVTMRLTGGGKQAKAKTKDETPAAEAAPDLRR
jgi:hypothetical protein